MAGTSESVIRGGREPGGAAAWRALRRIVHPSASADYAGSGGPCHRRPVEARGTRQAFGAGGLQHPGPGPRREARERREGAAPLSARLLAALLLLPLAGSCAPDLFAPPSEEEARALIEAAFGPPGDPDRDLFAGVARSGDGVRFRRARADELGALWRPGPYARVEIESMNCRYYPAWRVAFRGLRAGEDPARPGPVLVAEFVPGPALDPPDPGSPWRLVGRAWPARRGDAAAPDFRPRARGGGEGELFVTAWPTWAVPTRPDTGVP